MADIVLAEHRGQTWLVSGERSASGENRERDGGHRGAPGNAWKVLRLHVLVSYGFVAKRKAINPLAPPSA